MLVHKDRDFSLPSHTSHTLRATYFAYFTVLYYFAYFTVSKDVLYVAGKEAVKDRKRDLYAFFMMSLCKCKFEISCCDSFTINVLCGISLF